MIIIAIASFMGSGPFDPAATWLIWKVGLYGLINLTCLGIVISFDPMAAAFGQLAVEGSTPEIEGLVMRTFNISIWPIWTTYTLVVFVAIHCHNQIYLDRSDQTIKGCRSAPPVAAFERWRRLQRFPLQPNRAARCRVRQQ